LVAGVGDEALGYVVRVVVGDVEVAGPTRWAPILLYSDAKFTLKLLATGPPVIDFTSWASDGNCSFLDGYAFVASIATLPSMPGILPSAVEISGPGTATTITSAPDASPPGRPSAVTSWPARRHSLASPPPTFPRPITTMFIALPPGRTSGES